MFEIFGTIFFVYLFYYIVNIKKFNKAGVIKKVKDKKSEDIESATYKALPAEVKYFIMKYKVDLSKINKKGLLKLIAFILGLDITFVTIITALLINDLVIQILIGSIALIPLFLISMYWLGKYFKKKGLIKDEKHKSKRNGK